MNLALELLRFQPYAPGSKLLPLRQMPNIHLARLYFTPGDYNLSYVLTVTRT